MANTVAKIRLVRCPKCFKLLPEFAHVPMYQCGGCGTILRSKTSNIANENTTSGSPESDTSQSVGISDNGSSTSASISLDGSLGADQRRESSDNVAIIGIVERGSDIDNVLAFNSEEENGSGETKSMSLVCSDISRPHESLEEMPSLISSPADSSGDGARDGLPDKHRLMSRRTFRHNWGSAGSACSKANEGTHNEICKEKRLTSLGSESFYSVQSLIKPEIENEEPSQSLSRGSGCQNLSNSARLKNLKHNRAELLTLVEELKDELGGLCQLKEEKERICQSDTQQHQSSCTTCSYNVGRHSSKIRSSIQQASNSDPSSRPRKARPRKRFCRPASGGAPFVVCYKCFEVLHMPADFLISTRRSNRLKCGACFETLSLPFPARAHEVPQASADGGRSSEDPISFSVEYGTSFAESGSTDISSDRSRDERGLDLPLHRLMGYPSARILLH